MFEKILIANRGEIACRIIRTAQKMGVATVAVYSDADAGALHVQMADETVWIGKSPATESYLLGDTIIAAAKDTGAQAIHPGYGFLSENADFARAVQTAGLVFIGPSADVIEQMGQKDHAKALMAKAGVPIVPGYHGTDQDPNLLAKEAKKIGYPVLIKARAGGGGKGMRLVHKAGEFADALATCQREAQASFGDAHVLIEKYITNPRHIEVQVFGDNHGNVVHLFERDCSMQRRYQKVIEEAPAPDMTDELRTAMTQAAVLAATQIGYENAGTVEFIVDGSDGLRADGFWFMEMNTRLQVEHPVTEEIIGVDLVEWQLRVAAGEPLPLGQDEIQFEGHAVEVRIYAEDPAQDFKPSPGRLDTLSLPGYFRDETGVLEGAEVTAHYDPMIAKLIVHDDSREAAIHGLDFVLNDTKVRGTPTNISFLRRLLNTDEFLSADLDTGLIDRQIDALTRPHPDLFETAALALALSGCTPLSEVFGYRHFGPSKISVTFELYGETQKVHLEKQGADILVSSSEHQGTVSHMTTCRGLYSGTLNGVKRTAEVSRSGNYYYLENTPNSLRVHKPDPLMVSTLVGDVSDRIVAPITGTITSIAVKNGQSVSAGDPLLSVEAMKMEHQTTAPIDTKIASVGCAVGDAVSEGDILLTFEDSEA